MQRFNVWLILAVTTALSGGLLSACSGQADAGPAPVTQALQAQPVRTLAPQPLAQVQRVQAMGRLEAADEMRLAFKSGGVVAQVLVDTGDRVHKGQVLARLELAEIDAAVTRASEALQKAERDLDRARRMQARGLISQELVDNSNTARELAAADLRAARFNQAQATILAPADGRVLERLVKARETVAPVQPVLVVSGEDDGWLLRVNLADRDTYRIAVGGVAQVQFDAWPQRKVAARVKRIAGMADPASGTFEVELALNDAAATASGQPLRSGLIGRASIAVEHPDQGLAVPVSALVDANADSGALFVVEDGRARLRPVRLGALYGESVAVTSGLDAQDQVIAAGASYVNDGDAVQVQKTLPAVSQVTDPTTAGLVQR